MKVTRENVFQSSLIQTLNNVFPKCIITKNDPNYIQGIPDLTIKVGSKWADIEVKKSALEPHQPNQDYYINEANRMGALGLFIYPENLKESIEKLKLYFLE